ncbi:MAG: hypothetical protein VW879_01900 [Opitutae bacterium]
MNWTGEAATSCLDFLRSKSVQEKYRTFLAAERRTPKPCPQSQQSDTEKKWGTFKDHLSSGKGITESANLAGLCFATAWSRMRKEGYVSKRKLCEEGHVLEALELRKKGVPWSEVCSQVGFSKITIMKKAGKLGISFPRKWKKNKNG